MAKVDDDMKEDCVYSLLLDSLSSNLSENSPSVEDVEWADSCLNKHVDISDTTDWSSFEAALLDILSSQSRPLNSSTPESSGQPTNDDQISHSRENLTRPEFGRGSNEDEVFIDDDHLGEVESIEMSEDDDDDVISRNKNGRMRKKSNVENVFRPNYCDDVVKVESIDLGLDLNLTTYDEVEPSFEEIFKVWDLGVSDEQDDFTKQLNKALAEVPTRIQSAAEDSTSWKDSMNFSVDDLIVGIGDLSLTRSTK